MRGVPPGEARRPFLPAWCPTQLKLRPPPAVGWEEGQGPMAPTLASDRPST